MSRTALYRHFDAEGALLYVGITGQLDARDRQHASGAMWHDRVSKSEVQWCVSRDHARALEAVAIRFENPRFNVKHKPGVKHGSPHCASDDTTPNPLAAELEAAASRLGVSPSTVGERAGQGGQFYNRLLLGKRVWPETADAVRRAISQMEPRDQTNGANT